MRIVVIALLLGLGGLAAADELTKADIVDQEKRIDQRALPGYDHALDARDVFANIHDRVYHPAYQALTASRASYAAKRADLDKELAANDIRKATAALDALQAAGDDLGEKVAAYHQSSVDGVQKIQIGLGVLFFLVCGIVALIVKARNSRRAHPMNR